MAIPIRLSTILHFLILSYFKHNLSWFGPDIDSDYKEDMGKSIREKMKEEFGVNKNGMFVIIINVVLFTIFVTDQMH